MPPQEPILRVANLTKAFITRPFFAHTISQAIAVRDVSFDIHKGEIVGLLGPNGAGKTTTLQMLIGTLKPTSGTIHYFNQDFFLNRSELLQRIAFASGSIKLPITISVAQNLDICARLYGLARAVRKNRIEQLLTTFGIFQLKDLSTGQLSDGQISRVMIAKAFLAQPEIVFLDEATASLDPEIALTVRQFLLEEKKTRGTAMLFASHNMEEVASLCDRVLIMNNGMLVADSSPRTLAKEVTTVRVQFTGAHDIQKMDQFLNRHAVAHSIDKEKITIELDEHSIAQLLQHFAREEIVYSTISIEKPTLEDYFLKITNPHKTLKELA
ncbi:MAG TPA: ABC transporter ATP-binding protein [Candidatus Babeliales bacterium]|nr:ABC transporter ATP-binding protein [Candidatus Babeliales bacterium]